MKETFDLIYIIAFPVLLVIAVLRVLSVRKKK